MSPTPQLVQIDAFREVLKNYHVSEHAKRVLQDATLVLMVGVAGGGRNTTIKYLVDNYNYRFLVSDTTRPPQVRDGELEQTGKQYFFRTESEVLADLKAGEFLEAAIIHGQQVSGISIREIEKATLNDQTMIADIEIVGTDNIMKAKPDAVAIFLLPPSFQEWQKRLEERGQMSERELENRMRSAIKELQAGLDHDYYHFLIARELADSAAHIEAIIHGRIDEAYQAEGRELAESILANTKAFLNTSDK